MAYGQYSKAETAGRRMTMEDKRRFAPLYLPRDVKTGICADIDHPVVLDTVKNMGHNRALLTYADGTQGYMLHTTVIAWRTPDGRIRLDNGGWRTLTTRGAMREALKLWRYGGEHPPFIAHDNRQKSKTYGQTRVGGVWYPGNAFWLN